MPPLLFSCVVTVSQVVGHQVACSYWPRYSCMAFEHWAHPLICPTTFSLENNYLMKLKLLTGSFRKGKCPDNSV